MDRKNRRTIIRFVETKFGGIYKSAKNICRAYKTEVLPLKVLKDLTDIARVKKPNGSDNSIREMAERHNIICDKALKLFTEVDSKMEGKGVPLTIVKHAVSNIISNFKKGLKNGV